MPQQPDEPKPATETTQRDGEVRDAALRQLEQIRLQVERIDKTWSRLSILVPALVFGIALVMVVVAVFLIGRWF